MPISKPCLAVVCLLAPICVGCQSGGSFAMKDMWPWGKKDGAETSVAGTNYPQTPAQLAQPAETSMASQTYGPAAPVQGNPYAANPAASLPGSYAGAPAAGGAGLYDNGYAGYPTPTQPPLANQAMPAAAGGYPLADPNAMAQNPYATQPSFTPPAQQIPEQQPAYSDYSHMGMQPPATGDTIAAGGTMPPGGAMPAVGTAPTYPSGNMAANPYAAPDYTADARGAAGYANPAATMPAATQPYPGQQPGMAAPPSAFNNPVPQQATPPAQGGYTADPMGFQPGNTGYQPANNGFAPPGVQPYSSPGGNYQMPGVPGRSEAPYRPGSTGDYRSRAAASSGGATVSPASYEASPDELTPETAPTNPIGASAPAATASPIPTSVN